MRERTVEKTLVDRVKAKGGEVRKLRWVGRNGAPDRLVMLPGRLIFVELKAPGKKPRKNQEREHERLRRAGLEVAVVDSLVKVEDLLR